VRTFNVLNFLQRAGALKETLRAGWVEAGIDNVESVADHSYCCAILAMLFGDLKGLDTEKMIRMALLHDIHESVLGDLTPTQKSKTLQSEMAQLKAIQEVLSSLPQNLKAEYSHLVKDYHDQTSPEARLVAQLDKLEMAVQAVKYGNRGHRLRTLSPFLHTANSEISDPDLQSIMSTLLDRAT
jgi:putative hydrolase of HD superfamily